VANPGYLDDYPHLLARTSTWSLALTQTHTGIYVYILIKIVEQYAIMQLLPIIAWISFSQLANKGPPTSHEWSTHEPQLTTSSPYKMLYNNCSGGILSNDRYINRKIRKLCKVILDAPPESVSQRAISKALRGLMLVETAET
jgi:hypothetical protein